MRHSRRVSYQTVEPDDCHQGENIYYLATHLVLLVCCVHGYTCVGKCVGWKSNFSHLFPYVEYEIR